MKCFVVIIITIIVLFFINPICIISKKLQIQKQFKIESNLYPRLWSCEYKKAYKDYNNSYHSQSGEDKLFNNKYFKNKLNGIYVELGALDGLMYSNTFFFENYLGWSGILIEGGYDNCINLIKNQIKRPRSQIICSAICKNEYAEFKTKSAVGIISNILHIH